MAEGETEAVDQQLHELRRHRMRRPAVGTLVVAVLDERHRRRGRPDRAGSGYGRLVRLVDSGALTVAGFRRVRKTEL